MGETREHDSGAAVGQATAPPTITGAAIVDYKILEFRIRHPNGRHNPPTRKTSAFPVQNLRRFGRVDARVGRGRETRTEPDKIAAHSPATSANNRLLIPRRVAQQAGLPVRRFLHL